MVTHSPGIANAGGLFGAREKHPSPASTALSSIRFRIANSGATFVVCDISVTPVQGEHKADGPTALRIRSIQSRLIRPITELTAPISNPLGDFSSGDRNFGYNGLMSAVWRLNRRRLGSAEIAEPNPPRHEKQFAEAITSSPTATSRWQVLVANRVVT